MDDINALSSKLQVISRSLESYQTAVLFQEDQVTKRDC
jgi:hypothetical protein